MIGPFRRRPDLLADVDDDAPPSRARAAGEWLGDLVRAPGRWVRSAVRWPAAALRGGAAETGGRSWRQVAGAAPAVAAGAGLVLFAFVANYRRDGLAATYEAAARAAAADDDAAAAVLFRQRLGELGRDGETDRLRLAAALSAAGREAEAFGLLSGLLGGGDDPGYAPAHLLFAERLLADPRAGDGADATREGDEAPAAPLPVEERAARRARALGHLSSALRADPDRPEVKQRAAELLVAAGEPAAAVPLLESLAEERPEVWPDLMRFYAALGRPDDAARAAGPAAEALRKALKKNPLNLAVRVRLTDALTRDGRFDEAVATLAAGRSLHPSEDVGRLLAAMHVREYDRAVAAGDGRLGRRLILLERALEFSPRYEPALAKLANFAAVAARQFDPTGAAPTVGDARRLLERVLASGETTAGVHFALGLNALQAKDADAALSHFERAYRLDPQFAEAANNLAFLLTQQTDPDLDRALTLADAAAEAAPNLAEVRRTRGTILAALDRPEDALLEYERAMALGLGRDRAVRAEVADLYDRLGRPRLAEQFRADRNEADDGPPDDAAG